MIHKQKVGNGQWVKTRKCGVCEKKMSIKKFHKYNLGTYSKICEDCKRYTAAVPSILENKKDTITADFDLSGVKEILSLLQKLSQERVALLHKLHTEMSSVVKGACRIERERDSGSSASSGKKINVLKG